MRKRPAGVGSFAPVRRQEEARAHFHGLQQIARRLHPVAIGFHAPSRAGEQLQQFVTILTVFEERPYARIAQFHNAGGMMIPKVGDQQFPIVGIAFDFEREHVRYDRGESPFIQ
jgi:hypothetical protein